MKNPLNLFEGYKVIDLSMPIYPGVLKTDNTYFWGQHQRQFELRQFLTRTDKMYMHFVNAEIHLGTHVEGPGHLTDGAAAPADLPLETFYGEAIVLKVPPKPLGPEDFEKVKEGDIVLLYSDGWDAWITPEGGKCLLDKKIKMLGVENVAPDDPRAYDVDTTVPAITHQLLLGNNIPIIEVLENMKQITKERVFFIGLPLNIHDIDSSWIRAIVLEEE